VVAEALREAIFRGRIQAGGTPAPGTAIAKQFSVSQVTVREALRLLADEGVVQIAPRRGAIVASLSPEEVEEIVELRIALESLLLERGHPSPWGRKSSRLRRRSFAGSIRPAR